MSKCRCSRSITSFNMVEHLCDATFVPPTGQWGYARQLDPVRQPMKTKDGYISIAPYVDDRWVRFFQAAGHPEVLAEARFIDKPTRRQEHDPDVRSGRNHPAGKDHGGVAENPERGRMCRRCAPTKSATCSTIRT